jgi:ABC-type phosphate/phosphonate transport system substrate-binding protein
MGNFFYFFKSHFRIWIGILLIISCNGHHKNYEPTFSPDLSNKKVLIFGLPNLSSYGDCDLFIKYLNKNLSRAKIRVLACENADDYRDKLKQRAFDFTIINGSLVLDAEQNGYVIVGKMGDDDKYRSVIFVRRDSAIDKFSDLEGKTLTTSGPNALAGTMMPLFFLHKNGVDVKRRIKRLYAPSFESTIMNVYLGRCSAGASKRAIAMDMLKQRPEMGSKLIIKWETPPLINNALFIRNDMDTLVGSELTKLIFTLQDNEEGRKALIPLDVSKFEKANSETYKPLREFLTEYNAIVNR